MRHFQAWSSSRWASQQIQGSGSTTGLGLSDLPQRKPQQPSFQGNVLGYVELPEPVEPEVWHVQDCCCCVSAWVGLSVTKMNSGLQRPRLKISSAPTISEEQNAVALFHKFELKRVALPHSQPWVCHGKEQFKWNGLLSLESLIRRPATTEVEPRAPGGVVPVTFWAPSMKLCLELLHRHQAGSCLDLTAMDSQFAVACVELEIPYTGVAQTRAHARGLGLRIKAKVLQLMLDPASVHFSAAFAALDAYHSGREYRLPGPGVSTPVKQAKGKAALRPVAPSTKSKKSPRAASRQEGPSPQH